MLLSVRSSYSSYHHHHLVFSHIVSLSLFVIVAKALTLDLVILLDSVIFIFALTVERHMDQKVHGEI